MTPSEAAREHAFELFTYLCLKAKVYHKSIPVDEPEFWARMNALVSYMKDRVLSGGANDIQQAIDELLAKHAATKEQKP